MKTDIKRFIDQNGKINIWPSKRDARIEIIKYLATKFELGKDYTEKEVNAIINQWHTFGDYFILRRELVESPYMSRTINGSKYWCEAVVEDNETEEQKYQTVDKESKLSDCSKSLQD